MTRVEPHDPILWLVGRDPVTAHPGDTLRDAAARLDDEAVGVLLVTTADGTIGIVSERDIVRGIAEGADPDAERVADVMTDVVLEVEGEEAVSAVAATMLDNEIRHVVVSDGRRALGVVSIRDVLDVLLRAGRPELVES